MTGESKHYGILVFKLALCANLVSVLFNVLNDCDETYNYWEPLHFVVTQGRGGGFQTWEYSPLYGLRSYLYLWLVGWPAFLVAHFNWPMWLGFLLVRFHLAIWSAVGVTYLSVVLTRFVSTMHNEKSFGLPLSIWFCTFYSLSPGNFISATTFVPSGPATTLCLFMLAFWLAGRLFWAVGCVALTGIMVWPFAAFLGIPLAIHLLLTRRVWTLVKYACAWSIILIPATLFVDSYHFGRLVLAPLNIIRYNIFPHAHNVSGSASQLYGVEPATFYLKNYLLNQNIAFCLTCLFLVQTIVQLPFIGLNGFSSSSTTSKSVSKSNLTLFQLSLMCATPLILWNLIFFAQEHKEERFLFPGYPFLSLGAAIFAHWIVQRLHQLTRWLHFNRLISVTCTVLLVALFILASASRVASLTRWYSAPMFLIRHLPAPEQPGSSQTSIPLLCMGRDWHYFPSRFLLPGGGQKWNVGYLPSNFRGQLPGQFATVDRLQSGWIQSTRTEGNQFNAENREEPDRFVRGGSDTCDYIFDRDSAPGAREELYVADISRWQSVANRTILEPHSCGSSNAKSLEPLIKQYPLLCHLFRAFYIPYLSERVNNPVTMHILKRMSGPV